MKEVEYIVDDRVIIPEYIQNMTMEQLEAEITRMEKELQERKEAKKSDDMNERA